MVKYILIDKSEYRVICNQLGLPPYGDAEDELIDDRLYNLGEILEHMSDQIRELTEKINDS